MLSGFSEQFLERKNWFDQGIEKHISENQWPAPEFTDTLKKSFSYSLGSGGKRFRPVLAVLIGEAFGVPPQKIFPWALAVEMIHTYSLIHDDLPCMDNDDLRRGQPTNHKVFGESTALLAGDVLQTEAFGLIAEKFQNDPTMGLELTKLLAQAAGAQGMVSGQAIDMAVKNQTMTKDELFLMHALKTGALIRVAAEGAAVICGLPADKRKLCRAYGEQLGLAFQLKDDILDHEEEKINAGNFSQMLETTSFQSKDVLAKMGISQGLLLDIIDYNLERKN